MAKDLTKFIVDVKGPGLVPFPPDFKPAAFKINIAKINGMNLPDPETELIHQGIDSVIPDSQNTLAFPWGRTKANF
jgi:hypothetical protein